MRKLDRTFSRLIFSLWILNFSCHQSPNESGNSQISSETNEPGETFVNPIVDHGADPFVTSRNGVYYRVYADGVSSIYVTRFDRIERMREEVVTKVWESKAGERYALETWAPELHYLNGHWYIYYTAGVRADHRMFVLESTSDDPQGSYIWKGMLKPSTDAWAIDGTVLDQNGKLYFIWSGWDGARPLQQNIYMAPMVNPWTLAQPAFIRRYEAEGASITHARLRASKAGSAGQAVKEIDFEGSSVEFRVQAPSSGLFAIDVHYSNGTARSSRHRIFVNGKEIEALAYSPTTDWENWQTAQMKTWLNAGDNIIRFLKDEGAAELDFIEVKDFGADRVRIVSPDEAWERRGGPDFVTEGPEVLKKNGKIHIIYSASASWTDDYALGMVTFQGGDVMDPKAWVKKGPVFSKTAAVFGPGHCSFTTSPDGTEDWIIYHAAVSPGAGWNRNIRAQKFTWDDTDSPLFGTPIEAGVPLTVPR